MRPCGSGKKCCQGTEPPAPTPTPASEHSAWERLPLAERTKIAHKVQRLDDLSNGAIDAIEAKRYDEAERLCEALLRE
ncbi:MAG: hypothetical protein HYY16_06955 [Planctomycetes bacterium]|nr:hypothetical protein [Planctomycetota bacterium]